MNILNIKTFGSLVVAAAAAAAATRRRRGRRFQGRQRLLAARRGRKSNPLREPICTEVPPCRHRRPREMHIHSITHVPLPTTPLSYPETRIRKNLQTGSRIMPPLLSLSFFLPPRAGHPFFFHFGPLFFIDNRYLGLIVLFICHK